MSSAKRFASWLAGIPSGYRVPLLALLCGQLISWTGNRIAQVALPLLLIERYGIGPELGFVALAGLAPRVLLSPWAGVLADRLPLRTVIAGANLTTAGLVLLIPRTESPVQLYALSALLGALGAISSPANAALPPAVFPRDALYLVNTAQETLDAVSNLIGPGLAVVLVGAFGIAGAYAVDALTFVVSTAALLVLRPRDADEPVETAARRGGPGAGSFGIVADTLRADPILALLLLVNVVYSLGVGALLALYAPLALFSLRAGTWGYGVLVTATGVGALAGVLVTPVLAPRLTPRRIIALLGGSGILLIGVAATTDLWVVAALTGLALAPESFSYLAFSTESQRRVPHGLVGRYFGVVLTVLAICVPLGKLLGGPLAEAVAPGAGIGLVGAAWLGTAAVAHLVLRR